MSADFEFDIKAKFDSKATDQAKEGLKDLTAATKEQIAANEKLAASERLLANNPGLSAKDKAALFKTLGLPGGAPPIIPQASAASAPVAAPDPAIYDRFIAAGGKLVATFFGIRQAIHEAKVAIVSFAQNEQAVAGLNSALSQTGQFSQQASTKLQELAATLQASTGIRNTQWIEALTKFTQFGADTSNIEKFASALTNLTGITGNFTTAQSMMQRAMEGHFETFARHGIYIDEAGTKTEQLDALMRQLAERGAGQLETRLHTLSGEWTNLKNVTSNATTEIGNAIASTKVLQGLMGIATAYVAAFRDMLHQTVPAAAGTSNAIGGMVKPMVDTIAIMGQYRNDLQSITDLHRAYIETLGIEAASEREAANAKKAGIDDQLRLEQAVTAAALKSGQINPVQAAVRDRNSLHGAETRKAIVEISTAQKEAARAHSLLKTTQDAIAEPAEQGRADVEAYDAAQAHAESIAKRAEDVRSKLKGIGTGRENQKYGARLQKELDALEAEAKTSGPGLEELAKRAEGGHKLMEKAQELYLESNRLQSEVNAADAKLLEIKRAAIAHLQLTDVQTATAVKTAAFEEERSLPKGRNQTHVTPHDLNFDPSLLAKGVGGLSRNNEQNDALLRQLIGINDKAANNHGDLKARVNALQTKVDNMDGREKGNR